MCFRVLNHLILLKSDKNYDFSFLVKRRLFPNDLMATMHTTMHMHIPPYQRCTKFETFLPIIFAEIFLIFRILYVKNLNILRDNISRNQERLSSSFRNYNLLRSKLDRRFFCLNGTLIVLRCMNLSGSVSCLSFLALFLGFRYLSYKDSDGKLKLYLV